MNQQCNNEQEFPNTVGIFQKKKKKKVFIEKRQRYLFTKNKEITFGLRHEKAMVFHGI